jgi:hypothetical protein
MFRDGVAPVEAANTWGVIDKEGNYIVYPTFPTPSNQMEAVQNSADGLMAVIVDGQTGYIDTKGRFVINPRFAAAGTFSEGLAAFEDADKKWGFVGKDGTVVVPATLDSAGDFHEGLAHIMIGNLYGFIDKTGKVVITPQFSNARDFSEGLAAVEVGTHWGYIDTKGKIAIKPQFGAAEPVPPFDPKHPQALSIAEIEETSGSPDYFKFHYGTARVPVGGRTAYIDHAGKVIAIEGQWRFAVRKREN